VKELAEEAGLDVDDALILLWDADFEVDSPRDPIPKERVARARRALSLPTGRDLRSVGYLARLAKLEKNIALDRLAASGIRAVDGERLPRGTVARARKVLGVSGLAVIGEEMIEIVDEVEDVEDTYFDLPIIGRPEEIRYLEPEEVEQIHWALARDFAGQVDPIDPPGVRDHNLLASAVLRPRFAHDEELKYPTVPLAAAALLHSVVLNHAFYNGNKRTGLVSTLVFLERNDYVLEATDRELFRFVLQVAKHDLVPFRHSPDQANREVAAIAEWLCNRIRHEEHEDRVIAFRDLRRILQTYGCEITVLSGGWARIAREVPASGIVFRRKRRLKTHISYAGEGREVDRTTVRKVRRDLCLDEVSGFDSSIFYGRRPGLSDFVAAYRQTLNRLARL